jgi:hypothetical protein
MNEYLKVTGHNNLVRDPKTNSIINTNMSEYNEYINRKNLMDNKSEKIESIENEMNLIKDDINEIKSLLKDFVNGFK